MYFLLFALGSNVPFWPSQGFRVKECAGVLGLRPCPSPSPDTRAFFWVPYLLHIFFFLRAAPQHMEVPRLGVELELQHYRILNPLSKAKD